MDFIMLPWSNNLQIFNSIIFFILIYMMNMFITFSCLVVKYYGFARA